MVIAYNSSCRAARVRRLHISTSNARGTMLTRKTKLLLSLTAAVPLLFAACTDNGIFHPLNDAAGAYTLTVYKGVTTPHTYAVQPNDPVWSSVMPQGATV